MKNQTSIMRTTITILLFFATTISFGQKLKLDPKMIEMGWSFISPFVLQKVEDPLTREIISKSLPKIIREDIKGAVFEIADATFRIKNVKVLNKAFLADQEIRITKAIKAIKTKDYATAVNEVATILTISDKYIKSGILDKEEAKPSESESNTKTELVKSEEINGKVIIEKNNNYYFFVPNGSVSELASKDSTVSKFKLNLANGKGFEIGIIKQQVDDENWSIDYLEKNPSFRDDWTSLVSQSVLKEKFGEGISSPASLVNTSHFKAYKLPYLASSDASMTTSLLTFHNANLYLIYFKSLQSEFSTNSREFEDLIDMFFFGEPMPFCQVKRIGKVNVINKSTNPYDLYKNGELITTIKGKSEFNLNVELGQSNLRAIQKSGFMMYPTENKRIVNIKSPCQNTTIEIGFEDK
jgi:hypothetical protein